MRHKFLDHEYAGFRPQIVEFFVESVLPSTKSVIDPMSGTAPLIPYTERLGITSCFNEILPIHYFVNKAKAGMVYLVIKEKYCCDADALYLLFKEVLDPDLGKKNIISDQLIPEEILNELLPAWHNISDFPDGISSFMHAVLLLSIRSVAAMYSGKTNPYWQKAGGMTVGYSIGESIKKNIDKYLSFYNKFYSSINERLYGESSFFVGDALKLEVEGTFDTLITSPAYPNRFDYSRMYAPEMFFLTKVCSEFLLESLLNSVLATNKVKEYTKEDALNDQSNIKEYSVSTYNFLECVRKKGKKREADYYWRYFSRYYKKLFRIFDHCLEKISENGTIYVVIQNNIHRGEVNLADEFLAEYFRNKDCLVDCPFVAMRKHQGKRNISADYPLVLKSHKETVIRAAK
jgi:hypothetical protein